MFKINNDYFVFVFSDNKCNDKKGLIIDDFGFYGNGINSIVVSSFANAEAYSDV